MLKANPLERRLQIAGVILILGLVVEGLTLFSHGAVGFLVFAGLAGSLILLGMLLYLLALLRSDSQEKKP